MVVHVEDARGLPHPLEEHAEQDEVEGVVVEHRVLHRPEDELGPGPDLAVERVGPGFPLRPAPLLQPQVQLVDCFPGLERDDLADAPGVLPRCLDRVDEARRNRGVPGQEPGDHPAIGGGRLSVPGDERLVLPAHRERGEPDLRRGEDGVQHQAGGDAQHARGALRALEVAAQPEAVVRHAGDHPSALSTQVSLLPPPWLLLTT